MPRAARAGSKPPPRKTHSPADGAGPRARAKPAASDLLAVGEVAARTGLAVSALHFYEAKGLIASVRTAGNQRRYGRAVLRRLAVIRVAQRVGMPLATIAAALSCLPSNRAPTAADWRRMSAAWRGDLDARIRALTQLRDQLDGCIGCGCLSLKDCPLRNPGDALAGTGRWPNGVAAIGD